MDKLHKRKLIWEQPMNIAMWYPSFCVLLILFGVFHSTSAIFCSKVASPGQFKYLVEIVFNDCSDPGICGGAVLDETHVITAAHCVSEFNKEYLSIIAGTNDLRSAYGIKRKIEKIYLPDEYPQKKHTGTFEYYRMKFLEWLLMKPTKSPFNNDIAILRLAEALPLGEYISSVELPTSPVLPYDEAIPLASWGDIARNTSTKILRWANFKILDELDCDRRTRKDCRHRFCVMHPKKCSFLLPGDSGAPLVHNNILIGVASSGFLCSDEPAMFTRVFDYLEFIKESLKD